MLNPKPLKYECYQVKLNYTSELEGFDTCPVQWVFLLRPPCVYVTACFHGQVAGDMLFQDHKFDIAQVINYFHLKRGHLAIYYEMEAEEVASSRGIVEVASGNR